VGLIVINRIWGCSAQSFFTSWIAIELNLLLILPLIVLGAAGRAQVAAVKYVIIQRITGLLIIVLIRGANHRTGGDVVKLILRLVFLFKLGGFPFVQWVINVGILLDWLALTLLLTLQKAVPLFMLHTCAHANLRLLCFSGWLILPLYALKMKQVKSVVIISSVFNLIAILSSFTLSYHKWKILLLMYSVSSLPIIFLRGLANFNNLSIKTLSSKASSIMGLLIMRRIIGIPPLPGFFFKIDIVTSLISSGAWSLRGSFISGSGAILLAYLSIILVRGIAFSSISLAPRNQNAALGLFPFFIMTSLVIV